MKRIDTSKWKEFCVGDLFETEKDGKQVPTGASIPKLELKEKGSTPRISVTGLNNGILGYYDYTGKNRSNYRVYNNFVSVSFLGTVFYQKGNASLDMKVHCLKPLEIELNDYTGSFLVAAIKASLKNYAYSDQLSSTVLPNIFIKLPYTSSGTPDWQFMENYMLEKEQQTSTSIKALKRLTQSHKPKRIDTSNWEEFLFEDIFDIIKGTRLTKANMKTGDINYIGATAFNNGVTAQIGNDEHIHPAGTLSVCYNGSIGQTFYQMKPYWATDDVNVLYPKFGINQYIAQFLSSIIYKIGQKYDYKDKWTAEKMRKTKILLPVTSSKTPDWELMEQYMRQVEMQVKNSIIALTTPSPQIQQQTNNIVNYGTININEK